MDAAEIRARIDHPIIDADGHIIEFLPLVRDFLVEEAGEAVAKRFDEVLTSGAGVRALEASERRRFGISRTGWRGVPSANTLDRATAMLPRLLYERLDELGLDVAILCPTAGLMAMALDDELRCALARACNRYGAECYGEYADRLLPVAVVPNYTPEEALVELDYAVTVLGLRPVLFGGLVLRAAPGHDGDRAARWVDGLGLDSAYDYDPVWARCAFADVVSHWEKRNRGALAHYDPAALDRATLDDLVRRFGSDAVVERSDRLAPALHFLSDPDEDPAALDEFGSSGIRSLDDLRSVFAEQCFFGCEADDPMNAIAFDRSITPMSTQLQAMFASDIGHWDVPDFRSVLSEAWELVEHGRIDEEGFRAFTFEHAAKLFTGTRPDFFAGTAVEGAVAAFPSSAS